MLYECFSYTSVIMRALALELSGSLLTVLASFGLHSFIYSSELNMALFGKKVGAGFVIVH